MTRKQEPSTSPIIIVAAPRSGTNMLRNMLCMHPALVTWPCDEINPIWRYENSSYPTDELTPEHATTNVARYIQKKFASLSSSHAGRMVVEKTCANSLRVPFVDRVLPNAKYIFMIRDGRDAAASAMQRWTGSTTLSYILGKARWVPMKDLPRYGTRFARTRLRQYFGHEQTLTTWGPRFSGIDEMVASADLIDVCGTQWLRCVESARTTLQAIDTARVLTLRYEQVVNSPQTEFERIFSFCELPFPADVSDAIRRSVTPSNIGKHLTQLTVDEIAQLEGVIGSTLNDNGYLGSIGDENP